jgi:hypothetical protein
MQITLLLPIRVNRSQVVSDLERFLALGLPSLNRHLQPELVAELVVITPPEDIDAVRRALAGQASFPVRVVDEALLCPALSRERGWYKQQILKLASSELVQTPWYLTLDADVLCVRPLDLGFLFPDGRAIWQRERADVHAEWWAGSAEILRPKARVAPDQNVFGVTPALMHTASTRDLVRRLGSLFPDESWPVALSKLKSLDWTEYSLYWLHVLDSGRVADLYSDSDFCLYHSNSVWFLDQVSELDAAALDAVFDPKARHAFFVFQSRVPLPLGKIASLLRPRIGLSPRLPFSTRMRLHRHALGASLRNLARRVLRGKA